MSKRPITSAQVKTLRNNVKEKPLQELLLNLGVDLMMRSSDLLSMTVGQVVTESGKVKTEVRLKQKKTGKFTLNIPLSKNSINSIKKHLVGRDLDSYIFVGNKSHYTKSPITQKQYSRIVKSWMSSLGVENVNDYSTHSLRKTKPHSFVQFILIILVGITIVMVYVFDSLFYLIPQYVFNILYCYFIHFTLSYLFKN